MLFFLGQCSLQLCRGTDYCYWADEVEWHNISQGWDGPWCWWFGWRNTTTETTHPDKAYRVFERGTKVLCWINKWFKFVLTCLDLNVCIDWPPFLGMIVFDCMINWQKSLEFCKCFSLLQLVCSFILWLSWLLSVCCRHLKRSSIECILWLLHKCLLDIYICMTFIHTKILKC